MLKKYMMINFDLDTNKYEAITHKAAPTAYYKIRRYMENNDFLHRQGSCFITKYPMSFLSVSAKMRLFAEKNKWFSECVKELDVTTIEQRLSIKEEIQDKTKDIQKNEILKDNNIGKELKNIYTKELEATKDILDGIELEFDK